VAQPRMHLPNRCPVNGQDARERMPEVVESDATEPRSGLRATEDAVKGVEVERLRVPVDLFKRAGD
jgi:hypothetical protein